VSGETLAETVRAAGHPSVTWVARKEALVDAVRPTLRSEDLVLTLGAGDIWKVGVQLLEQL
jgi:UDP-N-acetylmuramate--alanine ligase